MRIFRMMNYVSDWCPYIFGMSSIWYFDVFFWCWVLDRINVLESWYWKSELDGSFTSQVYVTDVEFTRDGTLLEYIEKCRDWFRTYSLCSSGLYNCCHSCRLHIKLQKGLGKRLEKVAGEADTSTWPGQLYVWVENLKQTWENCRWETVPLSTFNGNFDDRLGATDLHAMTIVGEHLMRW